MKNYIKQYKDFLNESALDNLSITPKDLIDYLHLKHINSDNNLDLGIWLKRYADYYELEAILSGLISQKEMIRICLRLVKEIKISNKKTAFDKIKEYKIDGPFKSIEACERYVKGEIDKHELVKSNYSYNASGNFEEGVCKNVISGLIYGTMWNIIDRDMYKRSKSIRSEAKNKCREIFIEELENIDWRSLEKKIRGNNIFGE